MACVACLFHYTIIFELFVVEGYRSGGKLHIYGYFVTFLLGRICFVIIVAFGDT